MFSRLALLKLWEQRFADQALDSPRLSAQLLLAHVLGISRMDLLLNLGALVNPILQTRFEELAMRRFQGEPTAYLVGKREFYGLEFIVGPDVLVPRPETELFIDYLREYLLPDSQQKILDIGTGCGTLAVTCAHYFPNSKIIASDLSWAALQVARRNALKHKVAAQIVFTQGDLVRHFVCTHFDIILANLPYVPERNKDQLSREVIAYEPWEALFAGPDGLAVYARLASMLEKKVSKGTLLLCEINCSQGAAMTHLFTRIAEHVHVQKDYAGHDRLVVVVF